MQNSAAADPSHPLGLAWAKTGANGAENWREGDKDGRDRQDGMRQYGVSQIESRRRHVCPGSTIMTLVGKNQRASQDGLRTDRHRQGRQGSKISSGDTPYIAASWLSWLSGPGRMGRRKKDVAVHGCQAGKQTRRLGWLLRVSAPIVSDTGALQGNGEGRASRSEGWGARAVSVRGLRV